MMKLFEFERWARIVKTLRFGVLLIPFTLGVYLGEPHGIIGQAALFALGGWFAICALIFMGWPQRTDRSPSPTVVYRRLPEQKTHLAIEDKRESFADRFRRTHEGTATIQ